MFKVSIIFYKNELEKWNYIKPEGCLHKVYAKIFQLSDWHLWYVIFDKTAQIVKQTILHLTNVHRFCFTGFLNNS